ncbi:MAG: Uncharacterized protein G01um10147_728 [Microgenomates group bacterium Gr01-1014_7]|nr:MAG: Uncharacterized protein G01um10147_728 [Microgenomates group bacterium Gr01-1014_7]
MITLGIVLSLLLLSQAVKLTQTMFSPWKVTSSKSYLWNGDFNLNFLIRAKEISLVSFNPKDQKINFINIPDATFLEVARGFGKWQVSSIYDLGGDDLLRASLSQFFGLPIEGILDFTGKFSKMPTDSLIMQLKDPFSLVSILQNLRSDLTPVELIRLKMGMSRVRFDKLNQVNLESKGILEKTGLADGTEVLTVDSQRLDSAISNMVDPVIKAEHKTIAVFNSTDHPQLAVKAARIISNIGGDVIITTNSEKRLEKTVISGEKSKTLDRLWQIFGDPNLAEEVSSRAQINVFLGEDFASSL